MTELARRFGLPPEFVKFLMVGAMAFVVNQLALYLLYDAPLFGFLPGKDARIDFWFAVHPDARLLIASSVSVEVAILFKFLWSERWIFRHRRPEGAPWARMMHFNMSAAASAVLAVSVTNVLTPVFGITPYVTTGVGVLCGFMLNWVWSARLVWPDRPTAASTD
ncbi:MAG: GtrA family protein [Chloroflexi bacterium]|nr:GtrA family protein [Chloroflexota bacterium]